MLDSGAFTAWSQGHSVNVQQVLGAYKMIIDRAGPFFKKIFVINLDVIPGSKGVTPTKDQINAALVESDRNFDILYREFGDAVLPVFHQGEDEERLHIIAKQNPAFICVSPRNDLNEAHRVPWAQRVHRLIPGIPTHGLAATGTSMMLDVPWWSVDSATWVQLAGYGGIYLSNRGRLDEIKVSSDSPMRRYFGKHYDSSTPDVRNLIEQQAEDRGLAMDELRTMPGAREWFNICTLTEISQRSRTQTGVQEALWDL
jgi:hypothetical protein